MPVLVERLAEFGSSVPYPEAGHWQVRRLPRGLQVRLGASGAGGTCVSCHRRSLRGIMIWSRYDDLRSDVRLNAAGGPADGAAASDDGGDRGTLRRRWPRILALVSDRTIRTVLSLHSEHAARAPRARARLGARAAVCLNYDLSNSG